MLQMRSILAAAFLIYYVFLSPLWGIPCLWCATYPFDEEAVFCSYFKMSGEEPGLQDIEEFRFQSGRASFTAFKPSEIFMKNSIRNEKDRLLKKIEEIKEDSLFIWSLKGKIIYESKNNRYRVSITEDDLPQPTPFINSRISEKGIMSLKKALNSLANKYVDSLRGDLDISVSLKPESIIYEFQKRNIAHENVVLPVRYVIFYPIKVELPDKTMTVKAGIP